MPDERQESIRQGTNAPVESETGRRAAEERPRHAAEGPPIGGAMGGTSDADRPGDEAATRAAMEDGRNQEDDEDVTGDGLAYWNLPMRLRGRLLPPE